MKTEIGRDREQDEQNKGCADGIGHASEVEHHRTGGEQDGRHHADAARGRPSNQQIQHIDGRDRHQGNRKPRLPLADAESRIAQRDEERNEGRVIWIGNDRRCRVSPDREDGHAASLGPVEPQIVPAWRGAGRAAFAGAPCLVCSRAGLAGRDAIVGGRRPGPADCRGLVQGPRDVHRR